MNPRIFILIFLIGITACVEAEWYKPWTWFSDSVPHKEAKTKTSIPTSVSNISNIKIDIDSRSHIVNTNDEDFSNRFVTQNKQNNSTTQQMDKSSTIESITNENNPDPNRVNQNTSISNAPKYNYSEYALPHNDSSQMKFPTDSSKIEINSHVPIFLELDKDLTTREPLQLKEIDQSVTGNPNRNIKSKQYEATNINNDNYDNNN